MITYDEHLEREYPEHPLDQMDLKDIAAHLHAVSLEEFFRCKYEFQPLDRVFDELLDDLYLAMFPEPVLTLLVTRALEVYGEDGRREIEAALAKFNTKGEKNV